MNSTALGAEQIIFISKAHERFFHEKLKEIKYQNTYSLDCNGSVSDCKDKAKQSNKSGQSIGNLVYCVYTPFASR